MEEHSGPQGLGIPLFSTTARPFHRTHTTRASLSIHEPAIPMSTTNATDSPNESRSKKPPKWGFGGAALVVLFLMVVGQAVGTMLAAYPPQHALRGLVAGSPSLAWERLVAAPGEMAAKDWVFTAFLISTIVFLWLQREGVRSFLRNFRTGVTLVVFTTCAVMVGVLVPQIDGFEDSNLRVNLEAEREKYELIKEYGYVPDHLRDEHMQYSAFRWAEGYFLYHLLHLYGWGMPEADPLPDQVVDGLDRFGERYGSEERDNREKGMNAAFSGRKKTEEISAFIQEHEDGLWTAFTWCTRLHLNRTYKSYWFATLLWVLGFSIFSNTFRGKPKVWLGPKKLGFTLVHVGMLVMLFGGWRSFLSTERGLLRLDLRMTEPQDEFMRHYRADDLLRMPFGVSLEHFARKEWKALEVYFQGDEFKSRVPRYTLWPGKTIDLDYKEGEDGELRPGLRLEVKELFDRAEVLLPHVSEGGADSMGIPLAEIAIGSIAEAESDNRVFLSPALPVPDFFDPLREYRIRSVYSPQGEDAVGRDLVEVFPQEEGILGSLDVEIAGGMATEATRFELRQEGMVELLDGYSVEVVEATTNFRVDASGSDQIVDPRPLAEQELRTTAVTLNVHGPDGGMERRVVIDGLNPLEMGFQERYRYKELVLQLAWDAWTAPGPPRFVLHWGADGTQRLVGQDGSNASVQVGQRLSLPGSTALTPQQFLHRAEMEPNLKFEPSRPAEDGWDDDFYHRGARGLVLEAIRNPGTPEEHREPIEMTTSDTMASNFHRSEDGTFGLLFLENTEVLPFEWRSVLQIHEQDAEGRWQPVDLGSEAEREIRVNDYFEYKGYKFFQTDARPELPNYSGIGVVYDPGISIVLLGMYTIIAGTIVAFLLRPIFESKRKREASA